MGVGPRYVGETELPWDEGVHRGADATNEADEALRAGRWSLTGMAVDHVFYSADLLHLTGVVAHPVDIFWAESKLPMQEAPYRLQLDRVLFQGLPSPLDHTVYACPRVHAKRLLAFLDRFAAGDPATGNYWESVHQTMQMMDWALLKSLTHMPKEPPTVEVHLYALSNPVQVIHWNKPKDPWKDPIWLGTTPKMRPNPANPKTKTFAGSRRRRHDTT